MILEHTTTKERAEKILREGFSLDKMGMNSCLQGGKGIYFSEGMSEFWQIQIPSLREDPDSFCILEVIIEERMRIFDWQNKPANEWDKFVGWCKRQGFIDKEGYIDKEGWKRIEEKTGDIEMSDVDAYLISEYIKDLRYAGVRFDEREIVVWNLDIIKDVRIKEEKQDEKRI